ncbi:DNA alkylation repair protein [Candidatus Neomarinimicrobiota bacterium]
MNKLKIHPMAAYLRSEMKKAGDNAKAKGMQAYMKTDQPFYGVQAGPRRIIFRRAKKKFAIKSRTDYFELINELWCGKYREDMYQAIEIAEAYKVYIDDKSWEFFEILVRTATNWDTLDWIAAKLISPLIIKNRKFEKRLIEWSKDNNLWVRRASILAHLRHKDETNTELLTILILELASEKEFFIRKAIGWILREYAYTNPDWVKTFIKQNEKKLSGLSIREALKNIR